MSVLCETCKEFSALYNVLATEVEQNQDGWGECRMCLGILNPKSLQFVVASIEKAVKPYEFENYEITLSFKDRAVGRKSFSDDVVLVQKFKTLLREAISKHFNALEGKLGKIVDGGFGEVGVEVSFSSREDGLLNSENMPLPVGPLVLGISATPKMHFVSGIYIKLSRNTPQSPWSHNTPNVLTLSIQEIFEKRIRSIEQYSNADISFSASGREDIDVRCIGGRPFIVSVKNASGMPPESLLKEVLEKESEIVTNSVIFRAIKYTSKSYSTIVKEGEIHKQKSYSAVVWCTNRVDKDVLNEIEGRYSDKTPLVIKQKTPVRVLHRRTNMTRERKVFSLSFDILDTGCHFMEVRLETEAGTYIKEFVSGDHGRTRPSLGELLNGRCKILQLDVSEVKLV